MAASRSAAFLERLSLPDWAFYPVALGAAAAMVVFALSMREDQVGLVFTETRFEVFGPELARLVAGPGVQIRYDEAGEASRISSDGGLEEFGARSAGAGFLLPARLEEMVIGARIRVTMELRSTDETLTHAHIAYFTTEGNDSRWRRVPLGPDFAEVGFSHVIPRDTRANGQEWMGIWPDEAGLGRALEVRRLRVDILGPAPAGD